MKPASLILFFVFPARLFCCCERGEVLFFSVSKGGRERTHLDARLPPKPGLAVDLACRLLVIRSRSLRSLINTSEKVTLV